jgi:DNA polymerase
MGPNALREFAEGMGIQLAMRQDEEIVRIFREVYQEIKFMWYHLEDVIKEVLSHPKTERKLGPNGCIRINKLVFDCNGEERTVLRIGLPSGRYLHYIDAHLAECLMPWKNEKGEDVFKQTLFYAGADQKTGVWSEINSHGGKTFENIDQAISRDVLAVKLMGCEDAGMPVVLHVHDEGATEVEDSYFTPGFLEMNKIMSAPVDFAPGLPLAADGFEARFYHK